MNTNIGLILTGLLLIFAWCLGFIINVYDGYYVIIGAFTGSFITRIIIIMHVIHILKEAKIDIVKDKETKKWRVIIK